MKFQDSSLNGLKVRVGTKSVTHARTLQKQYAPPTFSNFFILNSFSYLDPISINFSQCMTSLLKLEITVSFLAFIASSFRVTEED